MMECRAGLLLGAALLGLTLTVPPTLAASSMGTFHFGKVRFEPSDTLAYLAEGKDPQKPIPVVILASFKIDRTAVMEAIDTPSALFAQAADSGNFVMVRMVSRDRCGVAGFLGQTQQQLDLGESFPAKTTASTASRIAGECSTAKPEKSFDDSYEFRLLFDVPVTTIPKPSPVPAGGGEPGKVFVALVKAIQAADWDGAHLHLSETEVPKTRPKASDMKDYFHGLALNYPKTVTVTGGLLKGDRAKLEIRGTDNDGKKIRGVVGMKKISGQWRVLQQNLFFAE